MIFSNCNFSINSFHPSFEGGTSAYNFHIGLKKEFAQKAFEMELPDRGLETLKSFGEKLMKHEGLRGFVENYQFFTKEDGSKSCLLSSVEVPGVNSCHLATGYYKSEDLYKVSEYDKYLEFHPHNIDNTRQAYSLLSLFNYWATLMDTVLQP